MNSRVSSIKPKTILYFTGFAFIIYSLFAFGIIAFILSIVSSYKLPFFEGMQNLSLTPYPQMSVDTTSWYDDDYKTVKDKMDSYPSTSLNDTNVFFKNNQFSPSCCANSPYYSNSAGCMCMSTEQKRFLTTRGGNNTPYHTI